jgi:hypothetical protein
VVQVKPLTAFVRRSMPIAMPPFRYWFSGSALFQAIAFEFMAILGIIALGETGTFIFGVCWVGAATLGFFAWREGAKQAQEGERLRKSLADAVAGGYVIDAITGGRSFCFFRMNLEDGILRKQPLQLWMDCRGVVYDMNFWLSPAHAERNHESEAYWLMDTRKAVSTIVYNGCHAYPKVLEAEGEYFIEFDARNGHWIEHLTVTRVDGKWGQKIRVFDPKTNATIWQE